MIIAFWDCEGVTSRFDTERRDNSDAYFRTLTELWKLFRQVRTL